MPEALLRFLCFALLAASTLGWAPETPHERAVEVLAQLQGRGDRTRSSVDVDTVQVPVASGTVRAKLYTSASRRASVVIVHGVHHRGIDEARLSRFARALASVGFSVLTPEIADLADYRITSASVPVVKAAIGYLAARRDLTPSGRVGLFGVSFGGGLALVAAADPAVASDLDFVTSVGGHHDLRRVLSFLTTSSIDTPSGPREVVAHEYGLAVVAYGHLERLVPAADLAAARRAFRSWLIEDRDAARSHARALSTERGRLLFSLLESHGLGEIGPELMAAVAERESELAALSPRGRLAQIAVPVYLVHGEGDRVIPPSEARWADRELGAQPHRTLVTSLLDHVTPDRRAGLFERLELVDFMAAML